ncbi:hypothetical protein [Tumebacillus lipolyticus]|uniref:ABC transporter permease n=1 Tax=Tumebacillus lipolyticus TaxID=1280370 RepID=A0ABW4ZRM7_9BACL
MNGLIARHLLFWRLFFRSWSAYGMLALFLLTVYATGRLGQLERDAISLLYETVGVLFLICYMQWSSKVDFDSKFLELIFTYPQWRWKVLLERFLFGWVLFSLTMCLLSVAYSFQMSLPIWKELLFVMPVYLACTGVVGLGTVLVKHSLGGLLLGLMFWLFFALARGLLGPFSGVILHFTGVRYFAFHHELASSSDTWILYNRLFFLLLALLLGTATIVWFARKER